MVKAILLVTAFGLVTAIPFMFLLTIPLALVFIYKQGKKYLAVKDGVERIQSGDYRQKIDVMGTGEIAGLAEDINYISSGLESEVDRRLKSERLKTELIVNVSHDLRTPLTSIITYIDLLKKEPTDNENILKYTEVISGKADRLKTLTDDLFDAAKAASGNIPVNLGNVDLKALINQGLGELDEKIKSSTLDFKVSLPEDKVSVYADGKHLWRVLENLLSNVLNYSLNGSRVYIDVTEDKENAFVDIKNISAAELNVSEDEIMDRFKRGDASRNSEGSGLGLDIAKSLMISQDGELKVSIDGDLFKATVKIRKTYV
jgi:signal transduction histidine kinase